MAGVFFQMKELEAKKRALVAESEAYRQVLGLQLQNLSLRSSGLKQKVRMVATNPLFRILPTIGTLFGFRYGSPLQALVSRKNRKFRRLNWLATAFFAWRAYGRIKPLLRALTAVRKAQPAAYSQPQFHRVTR